MLKVLMEPEILESLLPNSLTVDFLRFLEKARGKVPRSI
jgi:hypothetical protein